ncbi:unnamed protein product [Moneuplotes crassus]|uniref:Cyclic nucleotide-binding domain-containing protein n=1 Tax=Euplotes crassus TaxID=5936 RepID=A0AAD2DB63_EUPCR|nr:unnamed protein product [Moneuplotes crassus]
MLDFKSIVKNSRCCYDIGNDRFKLSLPKFRIKLPRGSRMHKSFDKCAQANCRRNSKILGNNEHDLFPKANKMREEQRRYKSITKDHTPQIDEFSVSSGFESEENDDYVSRNFTLNNTSLPYKLKISGDHTEINPEMEEIKENEDIGMSKTTSFGSSGSPSPITNARRILKKDRLSMSKNSSLKKISLKRTVSIINNQFKNLKSLREKKPVIMMKRVQLESLQNESDFKFKKFYKQSVDSNPHLKNLRRRMSLKKANFLRMSPTNIKRRSMNYGSITSISSMTNHEENDEDNFYYEKNFKKNLFPEWLENQEEFKKLLKIKGNFSKNNIFEICKKRNVERTESDHQHVYDYLKTNIAYFTKNFYGDAIKQAATKINSVFYKKGTKIFEEKKPGHKMYIVYNGEVGFYKEGHLLEKFSYNDFFGEKVIEFMPTREFTAIAHKDCELMYFCRDDYKTILTNLSVSINQMTRELLKSSVFKDLETAQRERLLHLLEFQKIAKGRIVYSQGDNVTGVYIVQKGKLEASSVLEMDSFRQYPVSLSEWEIERTTSSVFCKMGKIGKGEVFGYTELLLKSKLRMNKIVALEDTFMLYLTPEQFFEVLTTENIQQIVEQNTIKTSQQAIDDIVNFQKWNLIRKKASITAAFNREEKPRSSLDFIKRTHQIQDFIKKVNAPEIVRKLNEKKEMKIIKTKKCYKRVNDPHYLQLHSLDQVSRRTVRFALADSSSSDDGFK